MEDYLNSKIAQIRNVRSEFPLTVTGNGEPGRPNADPISTAAATSTTTAQLISCLVQNRNAAGLQLVLITDDIAARVD